MKLTQHFNRYGLVFMFLCHVNLLQPGSGPDNLTLVVWISLSHRLDFFFRRINICVQKQYFDKELSPKFSRFVIFQVIIYEKHI